jgi:hypothetical protein
MSTDDRERMAREFAQVELARLEAEDELARLTRRADDLRSHLTATMSMGEAVDAGRAGWVVMAPPARRPAMRVREDGLEKYREAIAGLGLTEQVTTWTRPKVSDLRANAAALAAHGVPFHEVVYEPQPQPTLTIVPRDDDA